MGCGRRERGRSPVRALKFGGAEGGDQIAGSNRARLFAGGALPFSLSLRFLFFSFFFFFFSSFVSFFFFSFFFSPLFFSFRQART